MQVLILCHLPFPRRCIRRYFYYIVKCAAQRNTYFRKVVH